MGKPDIDYRVDGTGPHVTLVHGVGANLGSWDEVTERMQEHFQIVRMDLVGHGKSGPIRCPRGLQDFADDVRRVWDHLGLSTTHLAGFSLGGLIAQSLALSNPGRIDRLVILSAVAGRTAEERWFTPQLRQQHPERVAQRLRELLTNDPVSYAAAYTVFANSDLGDEVERIRHPTFIATGEQDVGSNVRHGAHDASCHRRFPAAHPAGFAPFRARGGAAPGGGYADAFFRPRVNRERGLIDPMQYVSLGHSNLKVSRLGFGAMGIGDKSWRSWVLDEEAARPILKRALDQGINFIDTCDYYSSGRSEEVVGRLLRELTKRDEIVLATKVGNPMGKDPNARGFSRKHLHEAVNQSLRRLQTDYIDLYQTHIWDPATHVEEMVDAFDSLVRAGKVLYLGITDMPAWQLAKAYYHAMHTGRARFISVQNHYNPIWREDERELLPFCRAEGLGVISYSPMARGFLAGRTRRDGSPSTDDTCNVLGRQLLLSRTLAVQPE